MTFGKAERETVAVFVGGAAVALAVWLAVVAMARGGMGWLIAPMLGLILWREYVFGTMRDELDELRRNRIPPKAT